MIDFGWTRLAYLLVVLSVLGTLAQVGSPSADPRPLAAEPPDRGNASGSFPATVKEPHEAPIPQASVAARENPQAPAFARHLKRTMAGGVSAAPDAGKAVFYRPAPASPPPENPPAKPAPDTGGAPGPGPVCGDLGRFPSGHRLVFPLPMQHVNSYEDTWGAPRPQGGHEGTDLMVSTGTPEYAVTDGTIVPVTGSNGNGWNTLGGYALMLRAAYSVGPVREGDLFYYAHLDRESALPLGATVRAGQLIGYAGDTGQGPEVTRGLFPPHLHFGWYDANGMRSYLPSGAMNPYPLLEWLGAGSGVLGGGSKARYCEVPRSGGPTPSTGGDRWPAARDAGARPDLDTGTQRPAPGPAAGKTRDLVRPADQAAPAEKPSQAASKVPSDAAAPGQEPRASKPPASGPAAAGKPGKPASRGEPPPDDAAPAPEPHQPTAGQGPNNGSGVPASSPESEPPEEGGTGHPDEERGGEKAGKGEDAGEDPSGGEEGQEAVEEEPEEGEPEGDPAPPDEETTPDEDETASELEAGEDPESADPETGGSEESEEETPEETMYATAE